MVTLGQLFIKNYFILLLNLNNRMYAKKPKSSIKIKEEGENAW